MIPIMAPVSISRGRTRGGSFAAVPFFLSLTKTIRNRPPSIPRAKARNAEERGMCRLKTPMVPKISMEEINTPNDLRSFFFSVIGPSSPQSLACSECVFIERIISLKVYSKSTLFRAKRSTFVITALYRFMYQYTDEKDAGASAALARIRFPWYNGANLEGRTAERQHDGDPETICFDPLVLQRKYESGGPAKCSHF